MSEILESMDKAREVCLRREVDDMVPEERVLAVGRKCVAESCDAFCYMAKDLEVTPIACPCGLDHGPIETEIYNGPAYAGGCEADRKLFEWWRSSDTDDPEISVQATSAKSE